MAYQKNFNVTSYYPWERDPSPARRNDTMLIHELTNTTDKYYLLYHLVPTSDNFQPFVSFRAYDPCPVPPRKGVSGNNATVTIHYLPENIVPGNVLNPTTNKYYTDAEFVASYSAINTYTLTAIASPSWTTHNLPKSPGQDQEWVCIRISVTTAPAFVQISGDTLGPMAYNHGQG